MPIHTNIGALPIERLLFTCQKYSQTLQAEPARLTNEQVILATRHQGVAADFNDRRTYAGKLAELIQKEPKGPNANHRKLATVCWEA